MVEQTLGYSTTSFFAAVLGVASCRKADAERSWPWARTTKCVRFFVPQAERCRELSMVETKMEAREIGGSGKVRWIEPGQGLAAASTR